MDDNKLFLSGNDFIENAPYTLRQSLTDHDFTDVSLKTKYDPNFERQKICTRTFTMTQTTQSITKGEKYSCNQCDYNFTRNGNLRRHQKSIHEGVTYSCSQCDYKATQQSDLNGHEQS